jgi:hypothetical protein
MNITFKKLFSDYGIGAIIILVILAFAVNYFANYLMGKSSYGNEYMNSGSNPAYTNTPNQGQPTNGNVPNPAEPLGQNETYSAVSGLAGTQVGASCSTKTIQNPGDLLPKDTNSQWAQLNPSGKGELANINLLKSGYHIGIDTIGQSLRNANLQIRSEPPNPQLYVGPWQQSTITPDFLRPPLELGQGGQ